MQADQGTKIAVVGVGSVGATAAYALMISGLAAELVLIDVDEHKAEGEAMDLAHGGPFVRPVTVRAGKYADCKDAAIVVVTAGAPQKPGESRLDLAKKNVEIFGQMIPEIARHAPDAILLIVSNPVDILTYMAGRMAHFPHERVIGSGTVLDTARLRSLIGQRVAVDPRSVHAYVIGEHGDSEVVVWSRASVAGMPVEEFCRQRGTLCDGNMQQEIATQVRQAAYEIIDRKGATYYAIGLGVRQIVESIVRDQSSVLTVSTTMKGQMGLEGVALSLPTVVGRSGAETVLAPSLSPEEEAAFRRSAQLLQQVAHDAGL